MRSRAQTRGRRRRSMSATANTPALSNRGDSQTSTSSAAASGDPSSLPMYQRMLMFRQSPFANTAAKPAETPAAETPRAADTAPRSVDAPPRPTVLRPTPVNAYSSAPAAVERAAPAPARPAAVVSSPRAAAPEIVGSAPVEKASQPPAKPSASVLLTRKSPNLSSQTVGPRKITVGREAAYEVTMSNTGDVAAEELVVTIDLPVWAEVAGAEVSAGTSQPPQAAAPHAALSGGCPAWRPTPTSGSPCGSCRGRAGHRLGDSLGL